MRPIADGNALVLNANGTARLAWTSGLSAVEGATPLTWSWRDGAMCLDGQGGQAKRCLQADRKTGRILDANRQFVGRIENVTGVDFTAPVLFPDSPRPWTLTCRLT